MSILVVQTFKIHFPLLTFINTSTAPKLNESILSGLVNVFTLVLPLVRWWWCCCCLILPIWMMVSLAMVVAMATVGAAAAMASGVADCSSGQ
jgi:hypothetical protein